MSKPLLYVTFKRYPELGRLKVVESNEDCDSCILDRYTNACQDQFSSERPCWEYHYERADERQAND